tara:strand:- start:1029 stop:1325 length:297 start_codon:yes stop_codon:yes gene_type:complete
MKPNLFEAVLELVGGRITGSADLAKYTFHDGQTPPTEEEAQKKLKELQDDYDSKQYQRDRLTEYPSIQELVVALYDEEDKQAIIEKRTAVKAKYPKPK